ILSAHWPAGPESTSAATSTDASTTALNVGQRLGSSVSARTKCVSATPAFSSGCSPTRHLPMDARPDAPAPLANTPAWIYLAGLRGRRVHHEPSPRRRE